MNKKIKAKYDVTNAADEKIGKLQMEIAKLRAIKLVEKARVLMGSVDAAFDAHRDLQKEVESDFTKHMEKTIITNGQPTF